MHVPFEGPAAIAEWAAAHEHALTRVALHRGGTVPDLASFDTLVAMGGPMGTGDDDRCPFLRDEKRLLRACVEACPRQGFASPDGRAIGLQFHLEMRDEDVRALVRHGRDELVPGGRFVQAEKEILAERSRHGAALGRLLEVLLDRWLATSL